MAIMLILLVGCSLLTTAAAYDEFDIRFLQDITSHHSFYATFCSLIVCQKSDSINLIKMLSESFQRFVTVHEEDEALRPILDEPQTFILNLHCLKAREVLHQAEHLKLFGKPYQWILLTQATDYEINREEGNVSDIENNWHWGFLETLSLLPDSDVRVAERTSEGKFSVIGAYKISKTKNLLREYLAEWSPDVGLTVFNLKSVAKRRLNLHRIVIPSSLVITDKSSLNHLDDLTNKHIDTTSKVSYNVLREFEILLNMSISFKIVNAWGIYENGSWTGMLGDIEKGESEIGGAPVFLQKKRMDIIEYYGMVNPTGTKFIFLSPPLSYSNNIFIMPFDTIVWCCCLGMVGVSCFLLFTSLKLELPESTDGDEKNENLNSTITFTDILIVNIGAICLQGTVTHTKGPAGRIITLFLYLSYMFLYISYSASIVAILQSSDTSVQTFADILNSPLKAGAEDVAYSQYYFKTADDDIRRAIYRTKIAPKGEPPHFLPVEDGIKEVRKGLYAFHVETSAGYQIIQKTFTEEEKCGLQETRNSFLKAVDPWLVMKKKTPYSEIFKIGIKRIIETGFKSRSVRRYYTKKPVCSAKGSRFVSVGLLDSYYAFMLLFCGIGLSFAVMIMEICFSEYLKRKKFHRNLKGSHFNDHELFMN